MTTETRQQTRDDLRDQGWLETTNESWEYGRTLLYEDAHGWHLHNPAWSADFSDDTPSGVIALTCAFVMLREDEQIRRSIRRTQMKWQTVASARCVATRTHPTHLERVDPSYRAATTDSAE